MDSHEQYDMLEYRAKLGSNSQYGLDRLVDELLGLKVGGFFVECGASDGVHVNDTLFFEKYRGWTGLCIEPREHHFEDLCRNRKCICENVLVSDKSGEVVDFWECRGYGQGCSGIIRNYHPEMAKRVKHYEKSHGSSHKIRQLPTVTIMDLFKKHKVTKVDYFSLDVEGSELKVLQGIDFDKVDIDIFSIENEYGDLTVIPKFMASVGYRFVCHLAIDAVFRKRR